jgi:serine/threonine protein phosphatase PrpC
MANPAEPPEAFLTIGAFARTSRLSIKALRLYDEIGLLAPARVDPFSGYRYYAPEQLERARLVAWLRRLGMPLARIRRVCATAETDGAAAAREIGEYWRQVEAETAARRELADFLIAQLSAKETPMAPNTAAPLEIRYAAASDRGLVREENQDAVFAGPRLLAVADGFGGRGAEAGRAAIDALRDLDEHVCVDAPATGVEAGDLLNLLQDAAVRADHAVRELGSDPDFGSTLTAVLWTGSQLGLVHIGDSRAYLLRDGEFFQITEDHTLVQSLIAEGRLTPAEAFSHPQRTLLVKALGVTGSDLVPQLHVTDARAGDRYLLCTDGLSAAVPAEKLRAALSDGVEDDPAVTVRGLIELSHRAGGSDNVGCVVADVVAPDQALAA